MPCHARFYTNLSEVTVYPLGRLSFFFVIFDITNLAWMSYSIDLLETEKGFLVHSSWIANEPDTAHFAASFSYDDCNLLENNLRVSSLAPYKYLLLMVVVDN
jgi:hypothetical protein